MDGGGQLSGLHRDGSEASSSHGVVIVEHPVFPAERAEGRGRGDKRDREGEEKERREEQRWARMGQGRGSRGRSPPPFSMQGNPSRLLPVLAACGTRGTYRELYSSTTGASVWKGNKYIYIFVWKLPATRLTVLTKRDHF